MSSIHQIILGCVVPTVGGSPGADAFWSDTDKDSGVTISGGGLVATASGTGIDQAGQGDADTTLIAAGDKRYWEITIDDAGSGHVGPGVMESGFPFGGGNYLGITANSLAFYASAQVVVGAGVVGSCPTFVQGDRLNLAVDGGNKIWLGVNGTFDGDPAAGTGGIDISSFGDVYPAYNLWGTGSITANFGPTFDDTVPTGFSALSSGGGGGDVLMDEGGEEILDEGGNPISEET